MRDFMDWVPLRTRLYLAALLVLLLACTALGIHALDAAARHSTTTTATTSTASLRLAQTRVSPTTASPTATPGPWVVLWQWSGTSDEALPPVRLSAHDAVQLAVVWHCTAGRGLPRGATYFRVSISQHAAAPWPGVAGVCPASGGSYVSTLHAGPIQVSVQANGPWSVKIEARQQS